MRIVFVFQIPEGGEKAGTKGEDDPYSSFDLDSKQIRPKLNELPWELSIIPQMIAVWRNNLKEIIFIIFERQRD